MINYFCCYVIKLAGEIAKKILSIFWNLLLMEINLSQITISDCKREKVCAVCPYLLFIWCWWCKIMLTMSISWSVRPDADQSSKAAFGKSSFAITCSNVLSFVKDTTDAHQSSKKQKCFRTRFRTFQQKAFCSLHVPKRSRKYFFFLLDWCAPVISLSKESTFEHVLAKALLPKAALLDWSAPGLRCQVSLYSSFETMQHTQLIRAF